MSEAFIIAAGREVDGRGSLARIEAVERELSGRGVSPLRFTIDPLEAGWDTPVAAGHFRSGCAPIEALAAAAEAINAGADAAVIAGDDPLRTRYAADRDRRAALMAVYGPEYPLPEAYTLLARAFIRAQGLTDERFVALAHALYDNYVRTATRAGGYQAPPAQRFEPVTALFRAVDCANPSVDFRGRLLVASARVAEALGVPAGERVRVAGVGLASMEGDGPAWADAIATYSHLRRAYERACDFAGVDFAARFRAGEALLEAYTCYPVPPLGFLLASGIAPDVGSIPALLAGREITVTGGMNIAKAAWNNPALNALIAVYEALIRGPVRLGAVHGNGGLGYRQGVAILDAASASSQPARS